MRNKILFIIPLFALLSVALTPSIYGEDDYALARQAAKAGDKDAAFMRFLSILKNNPESKYREEALFAVAEYYYSISSIYDAFNSLTEFVTDYPDSEMKPFALFYLLKIAHRRGMSSLVKQIENEIINLKRVVLVFRNQQELKYKSPLEIKHRLVYYIDKVEFYVNEELIQQFSY